MRSDDCQMTLRPGSVHTVWDTHAQWTETPAKAILPAVRTEYYVRTKKLILNFACDLRDDPGPMRPLGSGIH